jgi:hypothetical protein
MALKHGQEAITEGELENALTSYLRTLNQAASNGAIGHRQVTSQWHGADLFVQWLKGDYTPTPAKTVKTTRSTVIAKPVSKVMGGADGPLPPRHDA